MKQFAMLLLSAAFILSACRAAEEGNIEVHKPWVRPTAQGENAAVYFLLSNNSENDDQLIGASSNVSERVEIHESKMENDVMQMNMLSSLPLESGGEFLFEPGGLHVMLIGIDQELKPGEQMELILHFANHDDIVVSVPVGNSASGGDNNHE